MEFRLTRKLFSPEITLGELSVGTERLCFTCEDAKREEKVPGKTCIPPGRYQIIINKSHRFQKDMPLLLNVPGFQGIRIHPGNTPEDTEGCILPGKHVGVVESKPAYEEVLKRIKAALDANEGVFITVAEEVKDNVGGTQ